MHTAPNSTRVIRLPETVKKTGLSRSTIYSLIKSGNFPKQVHLSVRTMGFFEADLDAWLMEKASKPVGTGA